MAASVAVVPAFPTFSVKRIQSPLASPLFASFPYGGHLVVSCGFCFFVCFVLGNLVQSQGHNTSCRVRGLHPGGSFLQPVMAAILSKQRSG